MELEEEEDAWRFDADTDDASADAELATAAKAEVNDCAGVLAPVTAGSVLLAAVVAIFRVPVAGLLLGETRCMRLERKLPEAE